MIVYSTQYPSKENLDDDVLSYRSALIQHSLTEGVPAPWPPNDLVEYIVKNNIDYQWELVEETEEESNVPPPLQGFEFVSEMYNSFLKDRDSKLELLEYQRSRAEEYPPIGDQLDALFHAGVFPEEMATRIQAVKDKFPKPSLFSVDEEPVIVEE